VPPTLHESILSFQPFLRFYFPVCAELDAALFMFFMFQPFLRFYLLDADIRAPAFYAPRFQPFLRFYFCTFSCSSKTQTLFQPFLRFYFYNATGGAVPDWLVVSTLLEILLWYDSYNEAYNACVSTLLEILRSSTSAPARRSCWSACFNPS